VRANAAINGLRVLESTSANKGQTEFFQLNMDCRERWKYSLKIEFVLISLVTRLIAILVDAPRIWNRNGNFECRTNSNCHYLFICHYFVFYPSLDSLSAMFFKLASSLTIKVNIINSTTYVQPNPSQGPGILLILTWPLCLQRGQVLLFRLKRHFFRDSWRRGQLRVAILKKVVICQLWRLDWLRERLQL